MKTVALRMGGRPGPGRFTLELLIRGYRRFLSGRGPLSRVVCSFAEQGQGESCSAFGLRVAREATGGLAALRLIRGRLRRCGAAALYRHPRGLLYGPLYDRAGDAASDDALVAALAAAGERATAQALVLRSAALVARSQGDAARAQRLIDLAMARSSRPTRLCLRDGRALAAGLRARLRLRLVLGLVPLVLAGLVARVWPLVVLGLGLVGVGWVVGAVLDHRRRSGRFERLLAARAFAPPLAAAPATPYSTQPWPPVTVSASTSSSASSSSARAASAPAP